MRITTGTKIPAILSASLAIGALLALASSTSCMILANVVSLPTRVALKRIEPLLFIVAPTTLSPTPFSTGMLSPVIAASSSAVEPSKITPSTGTLAPGLTITVSPITTSSTAISRSCPSRQTKAVCGARSISLLIASLVFPLDLASKYLPKVIRVKIVAADSK